MYSYRNMYPGYKNEKRLIIINVAPVLQGAQPNNNNAHKGNHNTVNMM